MSVRDVRITVVHEVGAALRAEIDAYQAEPRWSEGHGDTRGPGMVRAHQIVSDLAFGKDTGGAPQASAGESTQAAPAQVWHVYEEDTPQLSAPRLFTSKAAAEQGSIDLFQEMENYCPDYSWQPGEDESWELLAGGEPVGIFLTPVSVGDDPAAVPDFFRPDRTYTRSSHGRPVEFYVTHVSTPPGGTTLTAFGWHRIGGYDTWRDHTSDDFAAWTEAPAGGESRG